MENSNTKRIRTDESASESMRREVQERLEKLNRSVMSSFHGNLGKDPAFDLTGLFEKYAATYANRRKLAVEKVVARLQGMYSLP